MIKNYRMAEILLKTPIGVVKIFHTEKGIKKINLDQNFNDNPNILSKTFSNNKVEILEHNVPITLEAENFIAWIRNFFDPSMSVNHEPIIDSDIVGKDNFTGLVLRTLKNQTKPGTTVSYAGLAELCGSPKACRAVGQAMRANPLPLLVPCHRVIASNGSLGNYMSGKGNNIKAWLLEHEKLLSNA